MYTTCNTMVYLDLGLPVDLGTLGSKFLPTFSVGFNNEWHIRYDIFVSNSLM